MRKPVKKKNTAKRSKGIAALMSKGKLTRKDAAAIRKSHDAMEAAAAKLERETDLGERLMQEAQPEVRLPGDVRLGVVRLGTNQFRLDVIKPGSSTHLHLTSEGMQALAVLAAWYGFRAPEHQRVDRVVKQDDFSMDAVVKRELDRQVSGPPRAGTAYDIVPPDIGDKVAAINQARGILRTQPLRKP